MLSIINLLMGKGDWSRRNFTILWPDTEVKITSIFWLIYIASLIFYCSVQYWKLCRRILELISVDARATTFVYTKCKI